MSHHSSDPVETSPRYASTATTDGYSADGNAGAAKGGSLGNKTLGALKQGMHGAESFRQGVNSFADNAIQPSAARDADRGVQAQHRADFRPSDHGTEGHPVHDGPARGTGTSGFGKRHDAFSDTHPTSTPGFPGESTGTIGHTPQQNTFGDTNLTGTAASGGHTGTTSTGGGAGFSKDAQNAMNKAKEAWRNRS